jgi:hypothetical protein
MSKKTIKQMRNELVQTEVDYILELSTKNLFHYAADVSGFLDKKIYSDDEIIEFYNNVLGEEDDE